MTAAHHKGRRYRTAAKWIRDTANATPRAVCARDKHGKPCGRTLAQHEGGNHWTAGHTLSGSDQWQLWSDITAVPPAGDWLAPQASSCNYAAGAIERNTRQPTGYEWP